MVYLSLVRQRYAIVILLIFGVFPFVTASTKLPNIILILADDLGYSDLGSYGSEISTPHLDDLAFSGLRFANYHTAASCAPTRAMLMTGHDSHTVGVPNIPEAIPDSQSGEPNYQGVLSTDFETIANMLKRQNYRNYFSGKWHLGMDQTRLPGARGFDRSLTMADTGSDNWEQKPYIPIYGQANWFEDGERIKLPEDYYSSAFIMDKTIEYIDQGPTESPFFAFVSFMAVHIPVQAPAEYRDRYRGVYSEGWEALAKTRSEGLVQMNILDKSYSTNLAPTATDWSALDVDDKLYFERAMQVYAGMVESMDYHIGRLVSHLAKLDKLENTIFIFASDNGAEGSIVVEPTAPFLMRAVLEGWMRTNGYHNDFEKMGQRGSFVNIGPSWAGASVGPLSWFKFHAAEGGMRVPLIISGSVNGEPIVNVQGDVFDEFVWATDLAPTILEMAGLDIDPGLPGHSVVSVLKGSRAPVYDAQEAVGYELGGNKALFIGNHKLVYDRIEGQANRWKLFNISDDPAELTDLSTSEPLLFAEMRKRYDVWAEKHRVLEVPANYNQGRQVMINGLKNRPVLWILPGILLLFLIGGVLFLLRLSFRRIG